MFTIIKKVLPTLILGSMLSATVSSYAATPATPAMPGSYISSAQSSQNNKGHEQWKARHQAEENAILDQLNLTPDQRKKIEAVKAESHTQGRTARHQMHQQHKDFEAYLFSAGATEQGANAKIDANAQQMAEMGKLRVKTLFKIRSIMTPEQFQKFGTLQHQRWENKMKRHHHPGQGA